MPKFAFRLEAQDGSGHYRRGTGVFDSEDAARAYLERKEAGAAAYRLDTDELAELEGDNSPSARSKRALHEQAEPYVLVSLEKVGK